MIRAKIRIAGPGGAISATSDVVFKALQSAGATVTLIDEYPIDLSTDQSNLKGWEIEITVDHCPWGG